MDNQDTKIKFFNELKTSIDGLFRASDMLAKLWAEGNWRLRGDEIELIEKEIQEATKALESIDEANSNFKEITNKKVE